MKPYFIFPIIIVIALVYCYFLNKKAKSVRDSIDPEKLFKDFIDTNYPEYSNMTLVAAKIAEEGKDIAKHMGKLAAKKFAWGALGFRYRETNSGPEQLLVAFDDNSTVFIPVIADLFSSSSFSKFGDKYSPIKYEDSELKQVKNSEGSDLVVFVQSDKNKMVVKVSDKDYYGKDQSEKRSKFMQKVRKLVERTSL